DLLNRKCLDLSRIEVLVLDEADRMLDMGFIHDIRKIIRYVPKIRQTLLFSATYSKQIKTLSASILRNPQLVEIDRENTAAETVQQYAYFVAKNKKRILLSALIKKNDWKKLLVFTKTKHGANRLTKQLIADSISAAAIHGNKSQGARLRALDEFKKQEITVLVATDIAARGLDIDRLPHVVNYDLPYVAHDYVHRIGRTGRAGAVGEAISFVSEEDIKLLKGIERLIQKDITVLHEEGISKELHPDYVRIIAKDSQKENKRPPRRNRNRHHRYRKRKK
ncbi:MAG: helicase-related protein, partial [Myxococcota bacterium]|nr:helicase-related protein [Myxococcota bacterium]